MNRFLRLLPTLFITLILAIGGVFALFHYPISPPNDSTLSTSISLGDFGFPPDNIVPGGDNTGTGVQVGENHMALINNIIFHDKYGLNATQKPIIHTVLSDDGNIIYCNQTVQGGNLKHLAIDSSYNTQKLYFVILRISSTEYHMFTMTENDINAPLGTMITVYKTVLEKVDGEWDSTISYKGQAKVIDPGIVSRAIDVHSFVVSH